MWPHKLTEDSTKTDPMKQERVQGNRKGLMPEWKGNWFVKSKTTPRPVLKRLGGCGTPSLQQTGCLQKLSVVFYTSTASEVDQLQKILQFDLKLRSTGFDNVLGKCSQSQSKIIDQVSGQNEVCAHSWLKFSETWSQTRLSCSTVIVLSSKPKS